MDHVLGRTVGNALEVREAIDVLSGDGPSDVVALTVSLAEEMVRLAGLVAEPAEVLRSGAALGVFDEMVAAQGGNLAAGLPEAGHKRIVASPATGCLVGIEARSAGEAAWLLGAGRANKEDTVSATAGIVCVSEVGEDLEKGQPVLELHADDPARFDAAITRLKGAIRVSAEPIQPTPLVKLIIGR